jgi:hypothetical protein
MVCFYTLSGFRIKQAHGQYSFIEKKYSKGPSKEEKTTTITKLFYRRFLVILVTIQLKTDLIT